MRVFLLRLGTRCGFLRYHPCPSDPEAACKKALLIRIFYPEKTFQSFSIALIYLYIRRIYLNGLKCKPITTIHNPIALENPTPCLPAPQFKADISC